MHLNKKLFASALLGTAALANAQTSAPPNYWELRARDAATQYERIDTAPRSATPSGEVAKPPMQLWLLGGRSPDQFNSVALGGRRPGDMGIEFGALLNSEVSSSEYLDYSVPHSDYRSLGRKREGSTWGLDVIGYLPRLGPLEVGAGVGLYMGSSVVIHESRATGWWYGVDKKTNFKLAGQVQAQLALGSKLSIIASHHSLRGSSLGLGLVF